MSNVFRDQAKFMNACEQTVGDSNEDQFKIQVELILIALAHCLPTGIHKFCLITKHVAHGIAPLYKMDHDTHIVVV